MKIALTVVFVAFFVFLVVNRERLYVRDPAARVYRNNIRQSDAQVFMNYSTDVLLEQDHGDSAPTRILVQDWDRAPGTPLTLSCIRWVVCMTTQDNAPILPVHGAGPGKYAPNVLMSSREVSFVSGDGAQMLIELR